MFGFGGVSETAVVEMLKRRSRRSQTLGKEGVTMAYVGATQLIPKMIAIKRVQMLLELKDDREGQT